AYSADHNKEDIPVLNARTCFGLILNGYTVNVDQDPVSSAHLYCLGIIVIGTGNQLFHHQYLHVNLISSFSILSAWIRDGALHH
ncbi:MAG: hypothetical protein IJ705_04985, partial [Oscillospiraceae bacterium]|nr:hypothetical protein [Oscillospiraceae bacterium]